MHCAWSTPKIVLSIDHYARSIVVHGKAGKRFIVAIEYIRLTIPEDSFGSVIQHAIDNIDDSVDDGTGYENHSESPEDNNVEVVPSMLFDRGFSDDKVNCLRTGHLIFRVMMLQILLVMSESKSLGPMTKHIMPAHGNTFTATDV